MTVARSAVAVEKHYALVIKQDGSLWGRGYNWDGNLGIFSEKDLDPRYFEHEWIKTMDDVVSVSSYSGSTLVIKRDSSLWAFGLNANGQLGIGGEGNRTNRAGNMIQTIPVKIMEDVASAYTGPGVSYAVKKDGSLWAWGYNQHGQLGDGTMNNSDKPKKILDGVSMVSPGGYHTLALKTDGSVWAWGQTENGQIGNGGKYDYEYKQIRNFSGDYTSIHYQLQPVKVFDSAVSISAGGQHSLALKSDGSLWGWGDNLFGQLGNGGQGNSWITRESWKIQTIPIKVMDDVNSVNAINHSTFVIKSDNSLWGWGANGSADLGIGSSGNFMSSPEKIMDGVTSMGNGFALKGDGELWGWGANDDLWLTEGDIAIYKPMKILDGILLPSKAPLLMYVRAQPSSSSILVNGLPVALNAYTINGNNCYKLRDIAYMLSGTQKQFDVVWSSITNSIMITTGEKYTVVGGELKVELSTEETAKPNTLDVYIDGVKVQLASYNIDGNNYFKLRDVASVINFGVNWDGEKNSISIDTTSEYTN